MACCGRALVNEQRKAGWFRFLWLAALFGTAGFCSLTYLSVVKDRRWFALYWRVVRFFALLPFKWDCRGQRQTLTSLILLVFAIGLSTVFGFVGVVVLYGLGVFSKRCRQSAGELFGLIKGSLPRMFKEFLTNCYLWRPDLRCVVSGKLFSLSPAFSGLVFKYFNLVVLVLVVGLIAVLAGTLLNLAG